MPTCKCTDENSFCWPSSLEWRIFNNSVSGALLRPSPPSFQCHVPFYNAAECDSVSQVYRSRYWRTDNPVAMQHPYTELNVVTNKGCIGYDNSTRNSFCYLRGNLPYYVAEQIQKTVKFAANNNLRLAVRNTGHDYLGRSTAAGSLSLWLHHINKFEFADAFVPVGCNECAGKSAVIMGPGVFLGDVFHAARGRGLVVPGGNCPSIGIAGGWVQGGGNGLLSPSFGMGSDNVLQYKVVTADGKLRIANRCRNKDLFWALRGGGGGTYGVVVETVLRTYPEFSLIVSNFVVSANDTQSFTSAIRRLLGEMPSLKDAGWTGFFRIHDTRTIVWNNMNPTTNLTYAQATLQPFLSFVTSTPGLSYTTTQLFTVYPTFHSYWLTESERLNGSIIDNTLVGSWLIPRENHVGEENIDTLTQTYLALLARKPFVWLMFTTGGAIVSQAGCETGLNPAWRTALSFTVITANMPYNVTLSQRQSIEQTVTSDTQLLRDVAPQSGTYTNEADPNEPNWQHAFYGSNYEQLLEVKRLYDPDDLFLCPRCVGSEGRTKDLNCKLF